jgi:hypothetical protein
MAAGVALWAANALAHTAVYSDPLMPRLQTDPRKPPHFQKFKRPTLAPLGQPASFLATESGADDTGFDSTNSRRKARGKAKATTSPASVRAIAPGSPTPMPVSRYQKPAATSFAGAYAQAPGTPLVELGLTYKLRRSFQIKGEFQQYWLRSNVAGSDYMASVFLLGVRFQR